MKTFSRSVLKPRRTCRNREVTAALAEVTTLEQAGPSSLPRLYAVFQHRNTDVKLAAAFAISHLEYPPEED